MSSLPIMEPGKIPRLSLIGCTNQNVSEHESQEPDGLAKVPSRAIRLQASEQADSANSTKTLNCQNAENTSESQSSAQPHAEPQQPQSPQPQQPQKRRQCTAAQRPTNGHRVSRGGSNGRSKHPPVNGSFSTESVVLHRIREVREQQGLSVRSVARRLGVDAKTYRQLEDPSHNLSLAELHAVQVALDVPFADLLVDRQSLSQPVLERAKLVKVMKSAVAIREAKSNPRIERLAVMLCEQLTDLMPELADVSGWPQFGARRGQSALGKALQRPIDTSQLGLSE